MAQAEECDEQKRLCRNFRAILIGGFQADEVEVQDAAWILCKHIFDYSERQKAQHFSQIQSIIDSAATLRDVPTSNVEELHDWLFSQEVCNRSISLCIFAHSHGAKIVKDALRDERLGEYLMGNGMLQEQITQRIEQTRRSLAVITLGGIDDATSGIAKIVLNIRFKEDVRAMVGEKLYGVEENEAPVVIISGTKVTRKKPSKKSKKLVTTMFQALRLSVTGNTKHVLHDYVNSDSVMTCIEQSLQLSQRIPCDNCKKESEEAAARAEEPEPESELAAYEPSNLSGDGAGAAETFMSFSSGPLVS